jgi:hypothetical protein
VNSDKRIATKGKAENKDTVRKSKAGTIIFYVILVIVSLFICLRAMAIGSFQAVPIVIAIDVIIILIRITLKRRAHDNEFKKSFFRRIVAVLFMALPVVISLGTFFTDVQKKFLFFFEYTEQIVVSIKPGLLSVTMAVMLYLSVIVRRRKKVFSDWYDFLISALNILFCASFLSVFVSGEEWDVPFIHIKSQAFLMVAIVLSWIGMSSIAGFVWIALLIFAIPRMSSVDSAMGFTGAIYVLSAFMSILAQTEDIGETFSELKSDFFGAASRIANDASASVSAVKSAIGASGAGIQRRKKQEIEYKKEEQDT